jgi:protein N-terminal glutamine amidohydrolase
MLPSTNQLPLLRSTTKQDCTYTSCYCEENVYLLCDRIVNCKREDGPSDCWALWISNPSKSVAVWRQKGRGDEGLVVWDYHVILLAVFGSGVSRQHYIYDLDTTLPFPCDFNEYLQQAFRPGEDINPEFRAWFRLVNAREFLDCFSSDRSHMLKPSTSDYSAKPPTYPCILKPDKSANNVMNFADVCDSSVPGRIFNSVASLQSHVLSDQ